MTKHLRWACCAAMFVLGCASTKKATVDPYEKSVVGHELEADKEEHAAAVHVAHYDPYARTAAWCPDPSLPAGAPCWVSVANPTSLELEDARKHMEHAAQHRAASRALREVEARACQGVPDPDRDRSPFHHPGAVIGAEPLAGGATVLLRPVPGLTTAMLQRIVECHLARNAALGFDRPCDYSPPDRFCESSSPLSLREVTAEVIWVGDRFAILLRSSNPTIAEQILDRAKALLDGGVRGP